MILLEFWFYLEFLNGSCIINIGKSWKFYFAYGTEDKNTANPEFVAFEGGIIKLLNMTIKRKR